MIKRDVHADNERVFSLLSAYLSHVPDLIDADMMRSMTDEAHLPPATAYALLLCSLCGLDAADRGEGQYFYENYFVPMVTELDARAYKHDVYMKTVRFSESREGDWVLGHLPAGELATLRDTFPTVPTRLFRGTTRKRCPTGAFCRRSAFSRRLTAIPPCFRTTESGCPWCPTRWRL